MKKEEIVLKEGRIKEVINDDVGSDGSVTNQT